MIDLVLRKSYAWPLRLEVQRLHGKDPVKWRIVEEDLYGELGWGSVH
jgi:hypothetical protein